MKLFITILLFLFQLFSHAQPFIPLWPENKKPNSNGRPTKDSVANERTFKVGTPGIYVFMVPVSENKGTSVLICPGGGYERLSHNYSGFQLAKWFNAHGINAFVLIYRLPNQHDLINRQNAPIQDAQRAVKILRKKAAEWKIRPDKIGVMGISAGGHLAGLLGTQHPDMSSIGDTIDMVSCRPDFMILLSPVVTMGKYAHAGSKRNFLGGDTSAAMIKKFSNELQVTSAASPAFIVHALNDSSVSVRNSLLFFNELVDKKVPASIHVFPQGGHAIKTFDNPGSTDLWMDLLEKWLVEMKFAEGVN